MSPPENLTRQELLRRVYDDPAGITLFEGEVSPGLLQAVDFIRLAGRLHLMGNLLSRDPEFKWLSLLASLHSVAIAVINGTPHPFFDQQAAAIAANGGGRPGPTVMEAEARANITDIIVALARQSKQGDGAGKRIAGKYGGKNGLGRARALVAGHLRQHGFAITEGQLKKWAEWVETDLGKYAGNDRLRVRKVQAAMRQRFFEMSQEELLTETVHQMVRSQPVAAVGAHFQREISRASLSEFIPKPPTVKG